MPKGSLPGLWKRHAGTASVRASGSVGSPTGGSDCLPHGGLPHAAPGGGGVSGGRTAHLDELGKHSEGLGTSQRSRPEALPGTATAIEERAGIEQRRNQLAQRRREALDLGAGGARLRVLHGGLQSQFGSADPSVGGSDRTAAYLKYHK